MGCNLSRSSSSESRTNPTNATKESSIANMKDHTGINNENVENMDDSEETMFFDARQSFSEIVESISYGPTSTRLTRTTGISMKMPSTLLLDPSSGHKDDNALEEEEIIDITSKQTTTTTTTTTTKTTVTKTPIRESVISIKTKLGKGGSNITSSGYPGELTDIELDACLKFRQRLKSEPIEQEIVHAYAPAEEEAFALCRFLRSRAFNVDAVFQMLKEQNAATIWQEAKTRDFYRDFDSVYNCPLAVMTTLFPVVINGLAKNGATMFYFQPGKIDMNALECVADLKEIVPFLWYMLHQGGIDSIIREKQKHSIETTVLAERIVVVDMKNISTALFNTEFMKEASKITSCFPETMNRTYMLNVPTAFSLVWAVAKLFLEPRTIKKIGFFAWESKAKQDLLQFVNQEELLQDYGGTGPSFAEVSKLRLQEKQQQKQNGSSSSCSRYIVELLTMTHREVHADFDLEKNEKVTSIVVYSKSDHGANISIKKKDGKVLIESTKIERKFDNDKIHYSVKLKATNIPNGPGSFQICGTGTSKEYFLVVIGVSLF